jgi:hypothetical protein
MAQKQVDTALIDKVEEEFCAKQADANYTRSRFSSDSSNPSECDVPNFPHDVGERIKDLREVATAMLQPL